MAELTPRGERWPGCLREGRGRGRGGEGREGGRGERGRERKEGREEERGGEREGGREGEGGRGEREREREGEGGKRGRGGEREGGKGREKHVSMCREGRKCSLMFHCCRGQSFESDLLPANKVFRFHSAQLVCVHVSNNSLEYSEYMSQC